MNISTLKTSTFILITNLFINVFFVQSISTTQIIDILSQETYSEFTISQNSNPNNYWQLVPGSFVSNQISYKCEENRNWNPELLLIADQQTLSKHINTLAFTGGLNHFKVNVELNLFLIDVTDQSFSVQIFINDEEGQLYTSPLPGENPYILPPPTYCTEAALGLSCKCPIKRIRIFIKEIKGQKRAYFIMLLKQLKGGVVACNYCHGGNYDSQVLIQSSHYHSNSALSIEISSPSLTPTTYLGIISLHVSVELCDSNCRTCSQSSTNCITCNSDLPWLQLASFACIAQCLEGEYQELAGVNSRLNNTCVPCSTANCKTCDSLTCFNCLNGFYLNGSICSTCNSTLHCSKCANNTTCTACIDGYYLDTDGITCILCSNNCSKCTSGLTCQTCIDSFYLNGSGTCSNCSSGCVTCTEDSLCTSCTNNTLKLYSLDPSSLGKFRCVTDCGVSHFANNENDTCIHFQDAHCGSEVSMTKGCKDSTCDTQYIHDMFECTQTCKKYKYQSLVKGIYQCKMCPTLCKTCLSLDQCTSCKKNQNLFLSISGSTQLCLACPTNCITCEDTGCILCASGYYLNNGVCYSQCPAPKVNSLIDRTCIDCGIQYCTQCKNSAFCSVCSGNRIPVLNFCYEKCNTGYYRQGIQQNCLSCPIGCTDCLSSTYCYTCIDGYYPENNICNSCDSTCGTCSGPLANDCLTCRNDSENRFLFDGYCVQTCPNNFYSSGFEKCTACTDSACETCSKINQCLTCKDTSQFLIDYTHCLDSCPDSFQQYMNIAGVLICSSVHCSTGFELSPDTGTCEDSCGDGVIYTQACDDGNILNGDGCNSRCQVEPGFICKIESPSPSICRYQLEYSLNVTTGVKNSFYLHFKHPVILHDQSFFVISLEELGPKQYSYTISQNSNDRTRITYQISSEINFNSLNFVTVHVNNQMDSNGSAIELSDLDPRIPYQIPQSYQTIQVEVDSDNQNESSESQKSNAEVVMQSATKTIQTTFILAIVPLTIAGSISFVAQIVDISQLIRIPTTLWSYLDDFSGFEFPFITNFFELLLPDGYYKTSSVNSFERQQVSASFLDNAGQHFTITAVIVFINISMYLFGKLSEKIKEKTNKVFKYDAYFELIMSTYLEIIFYTILQWTNMDMDGLAIEIIGQICMWVTFAFFVPLPFIAAYQIKQKSGSHSLNKKPYESILKGLKNSYSCHLYYVYIHWRKLWFSVFLILINDHFYLSITLIMLPQLALVAFVIKLKPFEQKYENIKQIIQEASLFIAEVGFILLKILENENDVEFETSQILLAWMIIVFFSIIMIMHFIFTVHELYEEIIKKPIKQITTFVRTKTSKIPQVHPNLSERKIPIVPIKWSNASFFANNNPAAWITSGITTGALNSGNDLNDDKSPRSIIQVKHIKSDSEQNQNWAPQMARRRRSGRIPQVTNASSINSKRMSILSIPNSMNGELYIGNSTQRSSQTNTARSTTRGNLLFDKPALSDIKQFSEAYNKSIIAPISPLPLLSSRNVKPNLNIILSESTEFPSAINQNQSLQIANLNKFNHTRKGSLGPQTSSFRQSIKAVYPEPEKESRFKINNFTQKELAFQIKELSEMSDGRVENNLKNEKIQKEMRRGSLKQVNVVERLQPISTLGVPTINFGRRKSKFSSSTESNNINNSSSFAQGKQIIEYDNKTFTSQYVDTLKDENPKNTISPFTEDEKNMTSQFTFQDIPSYFENSDRTKSKNNNNQKTNDSQGSPKTNTVDGTPRSLNQNKDPQILTFESESSSDSNE